MLLSMRNDMGKLLRSIYDIQKIDYNILINIMQDKQQ